MSNSNQVVTAQGAGTTQRLPIHTLQIELGAPIPSAKEVKILDQNLMVDYWSPESIGENKVVAFVGVNRKELMPKFDNPDEMEEKDTAYFFEKVDGDQKLWRCSASRLVSAMSNLMSGQVVYIEYAGKIKNKTNNFESRAFKMYPVALASKASSKGSKAKNE